MQIHKSNVYFYPMIKVVVLGAGNVGTHLCRSLEANPEVLLLQNYNRKGESISDCNVEVTYNLANIAAADVYIVTYNDNALVEASEQLARLRGLVVHTSGATSINVFSTLKNYGVFYPVQSFKKELAVNFLEVPIAIEANTDSNKNILLNLAKSISNLTYQINSKQRSALHVSAVFANNFSNFMYTQSQNICKDYGIDFDILKPLIKETINKLDVSDPENIQTGPAIRKDSKTIERHKILLKKEAQKELYNTLTQAIQKYYEKEL